MKAEKRANHVHGKAQCVDGYPVNDNRKTQERLHDFLSEGKS
ncbi:MAG: hypothetical protein Q7K03_01960 [Dehalococcoidia bacterium]|nr:hypothetical protein [Dehalococcoidia bacterium]